MHLETVKQKIRSRPGSLGPLSTAQMPFRRASNWDAPRFNQSFFWIYCPDRRPCPARCPETGSPFRQPPLPPSPNAQTSSRHRPVLAEWSQAASQGLTAVRQGHRTGLPSSRLIHHQGDFRNAWQVGVMYAQPYRRDPILPVLPGLLVREAGNWARPRMCTMPTGHGSLAPCP